MSKNTTTIKLIGIATLLLLVIVISVQFSSDSYAHLDLPEQIDFNEHVRPILAQNCFVCHGPDSSSRKAGLRLDIYDGATQKLKSGKRAIIPGNAKRSQLVQRVHTDDPELHMPPPEAKKRLSEDEIAILSRWIDEGAEWKAHWAFIKPELPDLQNGESVSSQIDVLIYRQAEHTDLAFSPSASRSALIRRVSYILTGLPPSTEDLNRFEDDQEDSWYPRMVDYYLASTHFGERWARHWMDLVRYAEYMGHEFDYPINGAHHYRDYLIWAREVFAGNKLGLELSNIPYIA